MTLTGLLRHATLQVYATLTSLYYAFLDKTFIVLETCLNDPTSYINTRTCYNYRGDLAFFIDFPPILLKNINRYYQRFKF